MLSTLGQVAQVLFCLGVWDLNFPVVDLFQKMALRITEQWIRERVKLKHDNLGETIINFMRRVLSLLSVQSVQGWILAMRRIFDLHSNGVA